MSNNKIVSHQHHSRGFKLSLLLGGANKTYRHIAHSAYKTLLASLLMAGVAEVSADGSTTVGNPSTAKILKVKVDKKVNASLYLLGKIEIEQWEDSPISLFIGADDAYKNSGDGLANILKLDNISNAIVGILNQNIGAVGQNVTVNSDSTLYGSGTILGSVFNAGTISPSFGRYANSQDDTGATFKPGTILNIQGDYNEVAAGKLVFWTTPTLTDSINVDGNMILNNPLEIKTVLLDSQTTADFVTMESKYLISGDTMESNISSAYTVDSENGSVNNILRFTVSPVAKDIHNNIKPGFKIDFEGHYITLVNDKYYSNLYEMENTSKTHYIINPSNEYNLYLLGNEIPDANFKFNSSITVCEGKVLVIYGATQDYQYSNVTLQPKSSLLPLDTYKLMADNFTAAESSKLYVRLTAEDHGALYSQISAKSVTLGKDFVIEPYFSPGTYAKDTTVDHQVILASGDTEIGGTALEVDNVIQVAINTQSPLYKDITFSVGYGTDKKSVILKTTFNEDVTFSTEEFEEVLYDIVGRENEHFLQKITKDDTITLNSGEWLNGVQLAGASAIDATFVINSFAQNTDAIKTSQADAFRFSTKRVTRSQSQHSSVTPLEQILHAAAEKGPVSAERGAFRVWISPYVNRFNQKNSGSTIGSSTWGGGSLAGVERRGAKNLWTLGLLTGFGLAKNKNNDDKMIRNNIKSMLFGLYNTYKYWDSKEYGTFTHEILLARTITDIGKDNHFLRLKEWMTTHSSYKSTSDLANLQLNYIADLKKNVATIRWSVGTTYSGTKDNSYNEVNQYETRNYKANNSKSVEIYTGPGLRYIIDTKKTLIRLTGVYEYGFELKNTSKIGGASLSTDSRGAVYGASTSGKRTNKHYFQLNGSYLNRETNWKFILSYSGTFYSPKIANHTGMLKLEKRF